MNLRASSTPLRIASSSCTRMEKGGHLTVIATFGCPAWSFKKVNLLDLLRNLTTSYQTRYLIQASRNEEESTKRLCSWRRTGIWDRCRWRLNLVLGFRFRSGPGDETERTLVSHSACIDFRLSLCP
ncbi:hypothetical protein ACFX13_024341 [Malus domestica]